MMYIKAKSKLIDFIYENYNDHNIKNLEKGLEKIIGDIIVHGNYQNEIVKFTFILILL